MKKVYIETYGCQMNQADSEVVGAIVKAEGYDLTDDLYEADVIFVNTCSIRENAEQRVKKRLAEFASLRRGKSWLKIGVLGCMAERLQKQLVEENGVDIVVGPDSYRDIPRLLALSGKQAGISVELSEKETYADISPVKLNTNGVTAFISIMRGCENFCSYCVVPYTRGRERSRDPQTIVAEATDFNSFLEPNIIVADKSSTTVISRSFSSEYTLVNGSDFRAVIRQSISRTSSPKL